MRGSSAATDIRPSAWARPLADDGRLRAKALAQLAELDAKVRQGAAREELLEIIADAVERLR